MSDSKFDRLEKALQDTNSRVQDARDAARERDEVERRHRERFAQLARTAIRPALEEVLRKIQENGGRGGVNLRLEGLSPTVSLVIGTRGGTSSEMDFRLMEAQGLVKVRTTMPDNHGLLHPRDVAEVAPNDLDADLVAERAIDFVVAAVPLSRICP